MSDAETVTADRARGRAYTPCPSVAAETVARRARRRPGNHTKRAERRYAADLADGQVPASGRSCATSASARTRPGRSGRTSPASRREQRAGEPWLRWSTFPGTPSDEAETGGSGAPSPSRRDSRRRDRRGRSRRAGRARGASRHLRPVAGRQGRGAARPREDGRAAPRCTSRWALWSWSSACGKSARRPGTSGGSGRRSRRATGRGGIGVGERRAQFLKDRHQRRVDMIETAAQGDAGGAEDRARACSSCWPCSGSSWPSARSTSARSPRRSRSSRDIVEWTAMAVSVT